MAKRRHHQVINLVHFLGAQSHGALDASRFPVDLLYVYVTYHPPFVFHIVCTLVFQSFRVHAAHARRFTLSDKVMLRFINLGRLLS